MSDPVFTTPSMAGFKRVMLLAIIALALLSTMIGWGVMGARGLLTPALSAVQGVTALILSILFIAGWFEWLAQRTIELACLVYAVGICAVCMALPMYRPQLGAGLDLQPLYLWIPIVYVFAFTLTDHRVGLRISLGILVLFVGVSLPYVLRGSAAPYANFTLQLHFVSAVLIAALYFFSSYQHRLALAQQTVDQLARLSNTDELTGISNRRHMAAVISDEIARCADSAGEFAVVLFDVDHFKAINDKLGHGIGDQVLVALTARAAQVFRGIDSLGRWGGDEFVAVARNVDVAGAETMAEALRHSIASEPLPGGCRATISCGVTMARAGDNIDSLLQRADVALYAAKQTGRNRVERIAGKTA